MSDSRSGSGRRPQATDKARAREDWERRIGRRSDDAPRAGGRAVLPPPAGLRAEEGAGQVTLRWDPVEGALGYLVHRGAGPDGPFAALDHSGGDVLAVPSGAYVDTTADVGERWWYAIATIADLDAGPGPVGEPVEAGSRTADGVPEVTLTAHVDRVAGRLRRLWHLIGSERLSQLLTDERSGGRSVSAEFDAALVRARDELGVTRVRAHAIFHDDLGVYRERDGEAVYRFEAVDRVYDRLLEVGIRPLVELSFMPRDLASDPEATVFEYGAIISPPRDWDRWAELNRRLAEHLVERYGIEEVAGWGFEVWNEANLEVFWTGTREDYMRLYDVAARAIKSVDDRLLVGGPSTAAAGWIAPFLDAVAERGAPVDFVSTHTYGNIPLDVRALVRARGLEDVAVWWTEWGVTPTHFHEVTDGAFGAPFVLHGMKGAQGSADLLAYWVVSDHFEELGRPPRLLHGGFGLLSVGNLRKPRWWALVLAEQLADDLVVTELDGDGAGSLVDAWVSRHHDGRLDVLAWNGTLDQTKRAGSALLGRRLVVRLSGLPAERYGVSLARVDGTHSNLAARWDASREWPDDEQWSRLAEEDRLDTEALDDLRPSAGTAALAVDLPMPGVVRIRLEPR